MKNQSSQNSLIDKLLFGYRPYLIILFIGFILYFRTLFFSFSYLDDNVLILDNLPFLKDLGNFFRTFTLEVFHISHASAAYYRPILTISFMIDAQFSGAKPFFYHFSNILLHLITSCLVYSFLKSLNYRKGISFLLSLVFVVHPVLAQAVAWIPGRNDSLLTLFTLLSMIFLIKHVEKGELKNYFYHLLFFGLALFTKESAVFITIISLFYICLVLKKKSFNEIFSLVSGWSMLFFIWFLLRKIAFANQISYSLQDIIRSLFQNSPSIFIYLGKILFPFNLSVIPTIGDSSLVLGAAVLLIVVLLVMFSKNKNNRLVLFGTLWFLVFLIPSFIRPNANYVADFMEHRLYLPLIGFFIVINEIDFIRNLNFKKISTAVISIIFVALLFAINFFRLSVFKDGLSFWKNAVKYSDHHPLAHKNLGAMYYLAGNMGEAEKEFKKSLELNPTEQMIHNNLGLIYMNSGNIKAAENEYLEELKINPLYDNVFFNYGILMYQQGDLEKAEELWIQALSINPDKIEVLKNLFILSVQKKDMLKASYYQSELEKRGISIP